LGPAQLSVVAARTGQSIEAVTSLPSSELFIDGASKGVRRAPASVASASRQVSTVMNWPAGKFVAGSNLTLVCYDVHNATVNSHTIIGAAAAVGLRLSLDAPNPTTGTGSALALDGHDVALLRAEVIDSDGRIVTTNETHNVTFAVTAGPGRVRASHNGNPNEHSPNLAAWHNTFYGLARGIVQVAADATPAAQAGLLARIDVEGGRRTQV